LDSTNRERKSHENRGGKSTIPGQRPLETSKIKPEQSSAREKPKREKGKKVSKKNSAVKPTLLKKRGKYQQPEGEKGKTPREKTSMVAQEPNELSADILSVRHQRKDEVVNGGRGGEE